MEKYQDLGFSTFQIQLCFVIFDFPSKTFLFLKTKIFLSYQKKFKTNDINREEYIL